MACMIHIVAAARPNFMKVAPLFHALRAVGWAKPQLVHTGQHYDANMSGAFFRDFRLPEPDFHLGVGSGSHAAQTGGVMVAYENVVAASRPDWIIVVGDVNSTLACSLVGAKMGIRIAHLEAGLRSRDRSMPEEINRIVTDRLADLLWTPSPDGDENLRAEGVPQGRIDRVGNIMIDTFEMMLPQITARKMALHIGLEQKKYGVVTLHRPSNVDDGDKLTELVDALVAVAGTIPLVFPVHPRTRARLKACDLIDRLTMASIKLVEPLGYIDFMSLVVDSCFIITDSGGVQEETTYIGIPCLTLRENTERPITVTEGTNRLIKPDGLRSSIDEIIAGNWPLGRRPDLWDGRTATRVVESLHRHNANA